MCFASTALTVPENLATIDDPESLAMLCSRPVPTNGACGFNKGRA